MWVKETWLSTRQALNESSVRQRAPDDGGSHRMVEEGHKERSGDGVCSDPHAQELSGWPRCAVTTAKRKSHRPLSKTPVSMEEESTLYPEANSVILK